MPASVQTERMSAPAILTVNKYSEKTMPTRSVRAQARDQLIADISVDTHPLRVDFEYIRPRFHIGLNFAV
jgi:hypothetical protein